MVKMQIICNKIFPKQDSATLVEFVRSRVVGVYDRIGKQRIQRPEIATLTQSKVSMVQKAVRRRWWSLYEAGSVSYTHLDVYKRQVYYIKHIVRRRVLHAYIVL